MVNALKAAAVVISQLPRTERSPETTSGRDGFLHPYEMEGGVGQVTLHVLLRDFDTARLSDHEQCIRAAAAVACKQYPGVRIETQITPQYRNLGEGLAKEPRAVSYAEEAFRRSGYACRRSIIRGGTDGSRLTELGLPTPNLSSGQHTPHSTLEWACLDEMVQAAEVLVQLVRIWAEKSS
jgi:tripeptide aminopeptidase